jgi:DNA-binding response OmpR family regulator
LPKRALILDEDESVRDLFREMLASVGMDVLLPAGSSAAEQMLQHGKFDVVLLGMSKPHQYGVNLTRQIRFSGYNQMTPIIVVSDEQNPGAVSSAFAAGANFFLYKPVDKSRLMGLIRAMQGLVEHERRRFRRIPMQVKVNLKAQAGEVNGETVDISLDGMLVRASRVLPAGSTVKVSVFLPPKEDPVVGLGRVARVAADQMGIHLEHVTISASTRLQDFLLPRLASEGQPAGAVV